MTPADAAWSRTAPARAARALLLRGVFGPLVGAYARSEVIGLEHLTAVSGPAILVANHNSHVDTPILLRALPAARRRLTAVAAAADYFYATRTLGVAVSLSFGTVPVHRSTGPATGSLGSLERLIDDGWSVVLFAEGTRSRDGRVGPLHSGAAVLSVRRDVPIVPIRIAGTAAVMGPGSAWMARPPHGGPLARHAVTVELGAPVQARPGQERAAMDRVAWFLRDGAPSPSPPRPAPPAPLPPAPQRSGEPRRPGEDPPRPGEPAPAVARASPDAG